MSADELLERAAAAHRAQDEAFAAEVRELAGASIDRWEALTRGELDEGEIAELRALAAGSEAAAELWALSAPLPDETLDAMARALTASPEAAPRARSRRPVLFALGAGALAAAAAMVFAVLPPAADDVPEYVAEIRGTSIHRAASEASIAELPRSGTCEVVLRPATRREGLDLGVVAFVGEGASARRWDARVTYAESGAMRLSAPVETLLPAPGGEARLRFVIGPRDRLPRSADEVAGAGFRIVEAVVRVREP